MIAARVDLFAERWELARLAAVILQPALLIALAGGLVLASAHLVTMLGTRWGRRRVSQKALLFSVVVHFSLICGILALWPEAVPGGLSTLRWRPEEAEPPPPDAFQVQTIPEQVDTQAESPVLDNQAVWNQLPDDLDPSPERTPVEPLTLDPPPDERPVAPATANTEIAVATPLPAADAVVPEPVEASAPEPSAPAEAAPPVEIVAPEVREDVLPPDVERARSVASPDSLAGLDSQPALQRPEAAAIERIVPDPDVSVPPTSVAGTFDEQATLRAVDEGVEVVRPEGPAPADLPTPDAPPAVAGEPGAVDIPLRSTPTRERSTVRGAAPDDAPLDVERVRPSFADGPVRPREFPLVPDNGLARTEEPALERPQLKLPSAGSTAVPAPYRLRGVEERKAATQQFGGNAQSERAVELSLKWLADNQTPTGFWDASAHGAGSTREEGAGTQKQTFNNVGREADAGVTGLAVLAFLGRGHTLDSGQYRSNVERALRWLVAQQRDDGALGGLAGPTDFAYCHAMAAFALAEAYALSDRSAADWLRLPVQRAVQFSIDDMTADGGWRYRKGTAEGDMSVFGWQLMALKSAELGGITIPRTVQDRMVRFLIARSLGEKGGLAGYRLRERPTPSMTAEALYCKQRLGISRENPACAEAVDFLLRALPQRGQMNYYYWYYGSLAMRQYGGDEWTRWNNRLRDLLVQDQVQTGELAGSWDPNDAWGRYGGRIYSTALATLCLEVYYRYGEPQ